jgi:hypothetical protein
MPRDGVMALWPAGMMRAGNPAVFGPPRNAPLGCVRGLSIEEGKTMLVNPLHWYWRESHVQEVLAQMRSLGAPRLRAYFDGTVWHAREGTHRLQAAKRLGLVPVMVPVPWRRTRAALEAAKHSRRVIEFDDDTKGTTDETSQKNQPKRPVNAP